MNLFLNHIHFAYPDAARPVLDDVNLTFPAGWTGIIGDNGCGKTTLALVAAGVLRPNTGDITPRLLSEYCHQDSSIAPQALTDFACDWSREAMRLRRLLGIEDDWVWRFEELSGGQRKRLQVACSLWSNPDLLIVDEPTNDLDAKSREAIQQALEDFKGIGLLISHDRALLDHLVDQSVVFEGGVPVMRPGGYEKATAQGRLEAQAAQRMQEQARKEVDRIQRESARRKEEAQRSRKRLSARNVDRHDSSMREKLGRAKVSGKDGVAGRASAAMAKKLAVAESKLEYKPTVKRYGHRFEKIGSLAAAKVVCHLEETTLRQEGFSLEVPELWVSRADRIGITGMNGSGKSTLLRHVLRHVPDAIRVACIPQEVDALQRREALDRLEACSPEDRGRVLAHVGRLNSDPKRLLDGKDISPGELRKLILAELLLEDPQMLVMDEPTNHLDVGAIEALQDLIRAFEGAVVLVSHDERLVSDSCHTRWTLEKATSEGFIVRKV